jgi:cytochrome c-type biogenesis protein CcmH
MTSFMIVCAAMVAAALLWLVVPLLRAKPVDGQAPPKGERRLSAAAIALVVPLLAAGMYAGLSNWDWQTVAEETARSAQLDDLLKQLEARLQSNPDDLNGWLLLGRSSVSMQRLPRAIQAYQRAYELSRGENVDAILGLGEALAMSDESALSGRAGQLFDEALARAPNHPKALWYGSMAALQAGDLRKGRDRLQLLLAQGPPEELRGMLERQIQDLNTQISEAGQIGEAGQSAGATEGGAPTAARTIRVAVTLSPQLKQQLKEPTSLFVLARDPAGGPPLAVQRFSSTQIPLTVELSERDAMMPTRTIASAPRVQVVARLSKSGTPQAQSGDYFGQADYEFGKDTGTLNILIDQTVP